MIGAGEHVPGSYSVVSRYLSTGYLWDNVRVLGGAYGGFARFSESSGRFVYMSYRDPNLAVTLDVYDKTAKHLEEAEISDQDLLQAVIGTVGDLDGPLSPDQKGYSSFMQFLSEESPEDRQRWRDEILKCSPKDFKEFAKKLNLVKEKGSVVVVGSESALATANETLPKEKALKILKSKLYDIEREKKDKEMSDLRRVQVGSGDRSERIRTYNFPQNRITDHRINMTIYNLEEVLQEAKLDQFIDALAADDQARKISQEEN
jgi:Zn-dependent M16 (insulinase) family peptidase